MALTSTIYKAELQISDMDRNYYGNHLLTVAKHPSETDERMMMRILAFALYASDDLTFANGLTSSDEPDLWEKDLTSEISLWIMVGLPDEKQIKKALGRSKRVVVLSYGGLAAQIWFSSLGRLDKFNHLTVINVPQESSKAIANMAERSMKIDVSIQDNILWCGIKNARIEIELELLKK